MTRDSRLIIVFAVKHTAFGFGLAAVFVTALVWADVAGLGTLFAAAPAGWLAAGMLVFFTGLTFASVQLGIAIMQLGREDGRSARAPRPRRPLR